MTDQTTTDTPTERPARPADPDETMERADGTTDTADTTDTTDTTETDTPDSGTAGTGGTTDAPDAPEAVSGVDAAESAEAADSGTDEATDEQSELERLENEGDIAADYLEELLDIADLDGDLDMDVEGDRASVSIVGGDVSLLVGRNGEVLEALQELTRLAVYRETGERSRLMLDIGGFRADKRSRLEKVAAEAVAEVQASGERKVLDPMSPFERKVVHDAVAAAGLSSESEGEEPRRRVVVLPA